MAEGGAEHARVLVLVRPHDNRADVPCGAILLLQRLLAASERRGAAENLHIVVELLLDRDPIRERLRDGMFLVHEIDGDGLLRTVTARLDAEILEPRGALFARLGA